jgi:hypothetical protein
VGSRNGGNDKKPCGTVALESLESLVRNRLLHVKQSVDHALDTFKEYSHSYLHYTHAYFGRYKYEYEEAAFHPVNLLLNWRNVHPTPPNPTRKA